MSLSLSRVALSRVAGILACGPAIVALAGCHHRSSAVDEPSPSEQAAVGYADRTDALGRRRFPGVDVMRTRTGGFLVRIYSGLVGPGEPLYVLDGSPVPVDPSRGIDWVQLEDVVQIRVLKHPFEANVYGPRGVNGVIVITTKQAAIPRKRRR
jgi:hypothetical protein